MDLPDVDDLAPSGGPPVMRFSMSRDRSVANGALRILCDDDEEMEEEPDLIDDPSLGVTKPVASCSTQDFF